METYNFFEELKVLGAQNSLDTEVLIEKVKTGMQKAVQRMYPECKECVRVDIVPETQTFDVFILQEIVDEEPINMTQIHIDEARAKDPTGHLQIRQSIRTVCQAVHPGRPAGHQP